MTEQPSILVTNDDGIDATGLRAVYEALTNVGEPTVVAPDTDQSGTWRSRSYEFTVEEREFGYAVDGTPADCVNFGVQGLDTEFDVVVAGCNPGPNFGAHIVELSGTVGAARQAAFLGVPGLALSLYCLPDGIKDFDREDYAEVETFVSDLVPAIANADSLGFDYLNINVPDEITASSPVHVTELTHDCDIQITATEDGYNMYDAFYDPLEPDVDRDVADPVGTDRRAVAEGAISVTPLRTQASHGETDEVEVLLNEYNPIEE